MAICKSCEGAGCKICAGKGLKEDPPHSKYHNKKTKMDGVTFDSAAEARYYYRLKQLKAAGQIKDFSLQPRFELLAAFVTPEGKRVKAVEYVGDFLVTHNDGSQEVTDIKGVETEAFKIKAKAFQYRYPHYKFSVLTELPKRYGGGHGIFAELGEIRKIQREKNKQNREAVKNGATKKAAKKTKQRAAGAEKSRTGRGV